jgi:GT2 family glycosyltransferase
VTEPLVTIGVPVYRGQDSLPALFECLLGQSYRHLDILVSVDSADQASADACEPFLRRDPRLRMHVQPARLGWAGNTDWTMRHRRGEFFIYQQHDDLVSPTYVADLVAAAARWPTAVVCFAKVRFTGQQHHQEVVPSLLGEPAERVLRYLRRLDWVPLRGLIRGSALAKTSGLLLSDFDPYDSFGTEIRFLAELALLGEFRYVEGPTYFKNWHGGNLSAKRERWTRAHEITAYACLAAWMVEVIAPIGRSVGERRDLMEITIDRFTGQQDVLDWIAGLYAWQMRQRSGREVSRQAVRARLAGGNLQTAAARGAYARGDFSREERPALVAEIFHRLQRDGRLDPGQCFGATWQALEADALRR